ncbi:MAG: T9SS type A sorting domain-containing protein, partial [Candidatus Krumholzibacteria bacterium]|nr:T9SS type A sorting domain-containing protein [Candidatus Krumholzibacteria bacterium]
DPLTWTDQNDDLWYDPVTFYSGTSLDPGKTVSLAMGHDGTIWAGGNGLVQFSYEILAGNFIRATSLLDFKEKISSSSDGLVNGNVEDISVDSNGDIWVATATGLNRVSPRGEDALISAWIDLPNYLANPTYQVLYSPNVIAPMPGNNYAKIVSSGSGRQMLLSADQGTTLITVGSGSGTSGSDDPLKNVYAYPNPWIPGEPADQLKLGGLPDGTIGVEVYNVEGQLVFSDKSVAEGVGFWEGDNIRGRSVSSGMYVLRITAGKLTTTRILALVR